MHHQERSYDHCSRPIGGCVPGPLGEGDQNRKEWLEKRFEELAEIFAVAVGGFSVMDNHLHLLVRLDPADQAWSDEEVVRRWGRLFPPRDKSRQPRPGTDHWDQWRLNRRGLDSTREGMLQGFPLGSYVKLTAIPIHAVASHRHARLAAFRACSLVRAGLRPPITHLDSLRPTFGGQPKASRVESCSSLSGPTDGFSTLAL